MLNMRREWRRTSSSQAEPSPWRHCWTRWASCSNENQPLILKSFSKAPELPRPTTRLRRLPGLALAPLEWPFEWPLERLTRPAKLWNANCHLFVPLADLGTEIHVVTHSINFARLCVAEGSAQPMVSRPCGTLSFQSVPAATMPLPMLRH